MEDKVITRLKKWGGSYGLRVPFRFMQHLHIVEDTPLEITVNNGCLMIRPIHINETKCTIPENFEFKMRKRGELNND